MRIANTTIIIGGIVGTITEHVALMREEGQTDRCVDYFVGRALGLAVGGQVPGPADVPMAAYRAYKATEAADFESEEVDVAMTSPLRPMLLSDRRDQYLLMPIRL